MLTSFPAPLAPASTSPAPLELLQQLTQSPETFDHAQADRSIRSLFDVPLVIANHRSAVLTIGQRLSRLGAYRQATVVLDGLLSHDVYAINVIEPLVQAYIRCSPPRFREAHSVLSPLLEKRSGHRGALILVAELCRLQGRHLGAWKTCEALLECHPYDPFAWLCAGQVCLRYRENSRATKRYQARDWFRKVLQRVPRCADALVGLADLAAVDQQLDRANTLIQRALGFDPNHPEGLLLRAYLLRKQKRYEQALETCDQLEHLPMLLPQQMHTLDVCRGYACLELYRSGKQEYGPVAHRSFTAAAAGGQVTAAAGMVFLLCQMVGNDPSLRHRLFDEARGYLNIVKQRGKEEKKRHAQEVFAKAFPPR